MLHLISLKRLLIALLFSALLGCSTTPKQEPEVQLKADKSGITSVEKAPIAGAFIARGVQFSKYRSLLVEQLDLSDVKLQAQASGSAPWGVSDEERRYYQERYTEALMNNLILDGTYSTAMQAGVDVMTVVAKVVEVASFDNTEHMKGRPANMKTYSEGVGAMTLEISLYDSISGKPLAIITSQRRLWEENNRETSNIQVQVAFNSWLRTLRAELDKASGR